MKEMLINRLRECGKSEEEIAKFEIAFEYFNNKEFKEKLEDYVFESNK